MINRMTPQGSSRREVGIRELRNGLSGYLRMVAAGGEVIVTSRGKRLARLSGLHAKDPLAELRERGLVQEPKRAKRRAGGRSRRSSGGPVADLVSEQRR